MESPQATAGGLGPATLVLESCQFSRDAALRAAYWFSRDLDIEFPPSESESKYTVVLKPKTALPTLDDPKPKSLAELVSDFQNALIDFELRVRVQRETSSVRELLLAKAFAEAGVLEDNPPGSFDDPVQSAQQKIQSNLITITPKE
jgi:His-Xaa-Ser system protein HxsD